MSVIRKLTDEEKQKRRDALAKADARDLLHSLQTNSTQSYALTETTIALIDNLLKRVDQLEKRLAAE